MRNEQGVIVSLIVFIVLTLAFGVATYFGAKGFQEQKAALATARSELQSAIAENDTLRADLTNFKTRLGYGFGSADEIINGKDGSEKRVDKNGEEAAVHYAGMTDDVQKALGSDTNFKDAFGRNYRIASEKFSKAIEEIDKTITHLQKTKEALLSSENNLRLANNKAEDLSIKKLTKNAPSVAAMFEDLSENREDR